MTDFSGYVDSKGALSQMTYNYCFLCWYGRLALFRGHHNRSGAEDLPHRPC